MSQKPDDPFKDTAIHLRPVPGGGNPVETVPEPEPEPCGDPGWRPRGSRLLRKGGRIDWCEAARLLARGRPVEEVARDLSCRPERIWRNLRRSRRFRMRIELEHDRMKLQASLQFRGLGSRMVSQMAARTDRLDAKTLQWLADMLNVAQLTQRGQRLGDRLEELAAPSAPPSGAGRSGQRSAPVGPDGR